MIRALITDFGGVLVRTRSDASRRGLEQRLGLPLHTLDDRVFSSPLSQRAQHGAISEADFWLEIERELDLARVGLTWSAFRTEFFVDDFLDEDLMTLIRGVRPALKTGLISNAWSGLRQIIQTHFPIIDAFDTLVISAEEKLMKPDPRIYQLALDRLDVRADEAIFLDDVMVNIDACNALGMQGVYFQSSGQALHDIRALLNGQDLAGL
jgi:epoxide hydrolase-like predicted phosphatase